MHIAVLVDPQSTFVYCATMWCQNTLKTFTVYRKSAFFAGLHLMKKDVNYALWKHLAQRSLASSAHESTIGDVIDQWSRRFENAGIPEPVESIKHLVAHIIGTKKLTDISSYKTGRLNASQNEKLESLCKHRLSRMPVKYIIGEWDFRDITVKLVPPIFIPWPETEMFVDVVLKRLKSTRTEGYKMIEIGCGSGVITLALAHACKELKCTAIDMNPLACDLTITNRDKLNLTDRVSVVNATLKPDATIEISDVSNGDNVDLNKNLFDFVISNPPYVPTKQILKLEPEITTYEDIRALDGGDDGLNIIKLVMRYSAKVLKPGGRLFMEIHPSQPEHIKSFINKNSDLKLQHEHTYQDLANLDRYIEILKVN